MPTVATRHKTAAALGLLLPLLGAGVCFADDCGPSVYAYENRVVFYSCDKTGALGLNIVVLEDGSDLKIAGRVAVTAKRSFDAAAHFKDQLLILTWDRVEVFDTTDPAHPSSVATFAMKKQGKFQGYDRIEKESENSFLVLSGLGSGEVSLAADAAKWTFKDIDRTPAHDKMVRAEPPESRLSREIQDVPIPLQETAKFRYELVWKDKTRPGEVLHREYLRKVNKATQRSVSALLLGERLETID